MNIFTELELLYIIAYNLRQRRIYEFDVDGLERFLYEASCKEEYQALFLDMQRDPIDKKVRLDEAIATMTIIRGLKVAVRRNKLTARIAPLIETPQFEDVAIIKSLLDEYTVSREGYKVDAGVATERLSQIGGGECSGTEEKRDTPAVKKIVKNDI